MNKTGLMFSSTSSCAVIRNQLCNCEGSSNGTEKQCRKKKKNRKWKKAKEPATFHSWLHSNKTIFEVISWVLATPSSCTFSRLRLVSFLCLWTWVLTVICALTASIFHVLGDLDEDPGVTDDHDGQWQQEEAAKCEHVVGSFLPVRVEASSGCALSEVGRIGNGHVVKNEHLWD